MAYFADFGNRRNRALLSEQQLWCEVLARELRASRTACDTPGRRSARAFLVGEPGDARGAILVALDIDAQWWREVVVRELRRQWTAGLDKPARNASRRTPESYAAGAATRRCERAAGGADMVNATETQLKVA